jgi:hypothetical protein
MHYNVINPLLIALIPEQDGNGDDGKIVERGELDISGQPPA